MGEGVETANFIKSLDLSAPAAHNASVDAEEDSNLIRARSSAGGSFLFMPFGLQQAALIVSWEPASATASSAVGCGMEPARQIVQSCAGVLRRNRAAEIRRC